MRRGGAFAHGDEFGFFRGDDETVVIFEFVAQGAPPAFAGPGGGFGEGLVGQERGEVVGEGVEGQARVEIADDAVDELDGLVESFFLHSGGVAEAAGFDVGRGDRGERAGGEGHLHGLFASAEEFEFELADEKIRAGDAGAAPAFVQGESSGGELFDNFGLLLGEFSFVDGGQ